MEECTQNPLVSIIILNYNGENFIERCLKSVIADPYYPKEILLVDNASKDRSLEIARRFQDSITIVENPKNYGFPKGCNQGIQVSRGEIIILLNIDTVVRENWLKGLVDPLITDPTIGLTGSKLLFLDGRTIQFAGGRMHPNCLTTHDGYGELDIENPQFSVRQEVEYLTGASVAIRRKVLDELGGLDEGFPLYYEDIDFSCRAKKAGYRTFYEPKSVVLHFETFGTKKKSTKYFYRYHRGRIRFLVKNFGLRYFLTVFLPEELRWYRRFPLHEQIMALFCAYITQLPKAPYFWMRGFIQRRFLSA